MTSPVLHMLCGRIASGKSTLAAELAMSENAVLISEDDWLRDLFAEEMTSIQDYVRCSLKLRTAMGPHVAALLRAGTSVVLDFPANTLETRAWMREILDRTKRDGRKEVAHTLHLLDVPEEVCLARLQARNAKGDHPFAATEEQFRRICKHYHPPTDREGFEVRRHAFSS